MFRYAIKNLGTQWIMQALRFPVSRVLMTLNRQDSRKLRQTESRRQGKLKKNGELLGCMSYTTKANSSLNCDLSKCSVWKIWWFAKLWKHHSDLNTFGIHLSTAAFSRYGNVKEFCFGFTIQAQLCMYEFRRGVFLGEIDKIQHKLFSSRFSIFTKSFMSLGLNTWEVTLLLLFRESTENDPLDGIDETLKW